MLLFWERQRRRKQGQGANYVEEAQDIEAKNEDQPVDIKFNESAYEVIWLWYVSMPDVQVTPKRREMEGDKPLCTRNVFVA